MKWDMAGFQWSRPFLGGKSILFLGLAAVFFALVPVKTVHAETVKVVIDPGHGGENLGAQHNGFIEKNMTMAVAEAMAEELRKYEGIEVYLTRTEDVALSLQQRADYAKEVGADFVFCLHFNMSENHTLYGMEVWTSAFGKYYAEGKSFGELWLKEMQPSELYSRGVKTRLYEDGTDYYGIIKHSVEYRIPAVIIEHCHLDRKEDKGHYETEADLKKLGVTDATAVAKYFALYSPTLEADYRKYEKPKVETPTKVMKPDDTEPIDVSLTCLRVKPESGEVNILLTGKDPESGLLYYDYSLNGGKTYSDLQKWEAGDTLESVLKVPTDQDLSLKCRVYNGYDLDTETDMIEIPALLGKVEEDTETPPVSDVSQAEESKEEEVQEEEAQETAGSALEIDMELYQWQDAEKERNKELKGDGISRFLWLSVLGFLVSILLFLMMAKRYYVKKKKKEKYRRRKR